MRTLFVLSLLTLSTAAVDLAADLNDALTGHTKRSVGRGYGFKDMVRAFGIERLSDAIAKAKFPRLDLSPRSWAEARATLDPPAAPQ